jgi:hypothetical protein
MSEPQKYRFISAKRLKQEQQQAEIQRQNYEREKLQNQINQLKMELWRQKQNSRRRTK